MCTHTYFAIYSIGKLIRNASFIPLLLLVLLGKKSSLSHFRKFSNKLSKKYLYLFVLTPYVAILLHVP